MLILTPETQAQINETRQALQTVVLINTLKSKKLSMEKAAAEKFHGDYSSGLRWLWSGNVVYLEIIEKLELLEEA